MSNGVAAEPALLAEAVTDLMVDHGYPFVPDERLGMLGEMLDAIWHPAYTGCRIQDLKKPAGVHGMRTKLRVG